MKLAPVCPLWLGMALIAELWAVQVARADAPMKIAEEAGAWKVIIGGPLGIYVITQTDRAALGVVPADDGLYLYANVANAGLETITVQFDLGTNYTLAPQIVAGAPTYKILIDASDSPSFLHALTAGKMATIIAGPDAYPVSLAGTAPAIAALSFYGKEHDLRLPPPFTPARPYGSAPNQTVAATSPLPQSAPSMSSAPPSGRASALNATFSGSYGAVATPKMANLTLSDFALDVKTAEYSGELNVSFVTKLANNSETRWKASSCIRYYDNRNLEIEHGSGGAVNIGSTQSDLSNGRSRLAPNLWGQVVTIRIYAAVYGCADSPGEAISPVLTLTRQ